MIVVSVLMPTYNHANFIADAIESFLRQQVCFDVELLIGDDCSTDNTSFIARSYAEKYPEKIRFWRYAKNGGLLANYKYLLEQAKGKYVAILESDDVWIDPQKLQKQVDVMEKTPHCGLVFTNWIDIDEKGVEISRSQAPDCVLTYATLLRGNKAAAVTALFSRKMFGSYCNIDDYINRGFRTFDYPVWLSISAHAGVCYLEDYTAGYRHLSTSISNSVDYQKALAFECSIDNIVAYVVGKYGRGGLSDAAIDNGIKFRHIILALQFKRIKHALQFMFSMHVLDKRTFVIKFFPWVWMWKNRRLIGERVN